MTDKELKELVASLAISQKETDKQIKETDKLVKELVSVQKQTTKQLGELGNKWGTFAEGMAIMSIKKILSDQFHTPNVAQNMSKTINGDTIEIDAFGYENSTINTAVVVEIKSHLRETAIEQIEETMKNLPKFFHDHANKKLYGVIACVHAPENLRNVFRKKGIYLAVLSDETFKLYDFKNFTPTDFSQKRA